MLHATSTVENRENIALKFIAYHFFTIILLFTLENTVSFLFWSLNAIKLTLL